ncbi:MAG: cob(I)yrinic acid a,c-diamide adenosyltransferase [Flavobacteriales bacterium]|nr:cob(I)yrinic acid a,c-diamide adenosyltransferase [Flavobacteriales bacterium]
MKIYTRTGDKGETGLLGGARVQKSDLRIEAYGTVDELNSHVGLLRDLAMPHHGELLVTIQHALFTIGSHLASSSAEERARFKVPAITEADITGLEQAMDAMDMGLEPMRSFILPGGHPCSSQAHICRTVCRRAERRVVELAAIAEVDGLLIRYLNRLSDYFFVLARDLSKVHGVPDTPWRPKG